MFRALIPSIFRSIRLCVTACGIMHTRCFRPLPAGNSRYSYWVRAGRSGDRILVEARFSAPVQTGPGAHPASCTMGTGSFPGVRSCRGVTLTPHPLLVPWSWKGRAIPLLPLWAVRPVQSLSACTRVHFWYLLYSLKISTNLAEIYACEFFYNEYCADGLFGGYYYFYFLICFERHF